MATLVKTVADFTIVSTWRGYTYEINGDEFIGYTNSTTITANKTFSLEGLPADAILDSATLESMLNSPYSGIAIRRVDDVAFNGSKDVLTKLQALDGNYAAGVEFAYKFKAQGNTGGLGDHSSTQQFYDNILTIVYHMPNSLLTLDPASEVAAGATVTAYIEAGSSAYTHRVAYAIGSHNGYVDATAGQTQKTFSFPLSWLDAVPNGTSVQGTVVLYTYSGSTLLGTDVKYITVTVPASVVPVINSVTPTRVDGTVPSAWGKYVKGKSKLKLDVSASGIYGSTITAAAIYERASGVDTLVTNMTLSGSVWTGTTPYLASSGTKTYVVKVTDSRGRKAENSGTAITVYDYYLPSISGVIIQRCLADKTPDVSGPYIGVYAEFSYASVGGSNTAAGTVQYRQMPSGSWSSVQTLTNETLIAIGGGSIDITKSYQVYIAYADAFYTAEYTDDVGTASCLFDAEGDTKAAFFGYAENDGFEVKGNKEIRYKGATLDARFGRFIVYRSPDDFGFSIALDTTMPALVAAMPNYSILICEPSASGTGGLFPAQESTGMLRITRGSGLYRLSVEFLAKSGRYFRYRIYSNDSGATWYDLGWKEIAMDGGSLNDTLSLPKIRITDDSTDASGTVANNVALIIGNQSYTHLEMDKDEIMAKSNGTTPSTLYLNHNGGEVKINGNVVFHKGNLTHGTSSPSGGSSGDIYLKHT